MSRHHYQFEIWLIMDRLPHPINQQALREWHFTINEDAGEWS